MKQWTCHSLVVSLALLGTACDRGSEQAADEARRQPNDAAKHDAELREVVEAERAEALRRRDQLQRMLSKKNEELYDKRVELDRLTPNVGDPSRCRPPSIHPALEIRGLGVQKSNVQAEISSLTLHKDRIKELNDKGEWPPPPDPSLVEQQVNLNPEVQFLFNRIIQIDVARTGPKAADPNSRVARQLRELRNATQDQLDEVRARVQIEIEAELATLSDGGSAADAIEEIDSQIALWNESVRKIDAQITEKAKNLKEIQEKDVEFHQLLVEVVQLVEITKSLSAELHLLE